MKQFTIALFLGVVTVFSVQVYAMPKNDSAAPASQPLPAANAAHADTSLSGKVVETMNSGGYTYISLEKNGKKIWIERGLVKNPIAEQIA